MASNDPHASLLNQGRLRWDHTVKDWNVVVTVNEAGYRQVRRLLAPYGAIAPTDYYNVMVMQVADPSGMMDDLTNRIEESPGLMNDLSRVVPAAHTFDFGSPEEFEQQARAIVLNWLDQLAGISGVGQAKLERYGEEFLAVIAGHEAG